MRTTLTIKNFRIFDSEGHTFEINPITLLTGCNNSGKSSFVKACALFAEWVKEWTKFGYKRMFAEPLRLSNETLKLGRLDTVINSQNQNDKTIVFVFKSSTLAPEDIHITYTFINRKEDIANNAWLSNLKITDSHERIIFEADRERSSYSFNLLPLKIWACELGEYKEYCHDLYHGGPTSSYEDNMSDIARKLAKECKTYKKFREKLSEYLWERYTEEELDKLENNGYHIRPLNKKYVSLPLIYCEQTQKLDSISKEYFFNNIVEGVKSGNMFPSNGWIVSDHEYAALFENLQIVSKAYIASPYSTFSEFLGALENEYGLSFNLDFDNTRNDIDAETLGYSMLFHGTKKEDNLYMRCINLLSDLFHGYLGKSFYETFGLKIFMEEILMPFISGALKLNSLKEFNYVGTCQLALNRVYPLNRGTDIFSIVLNEYIASTNNIGKKYKSGEFINKRGFFVDKWLRNFSIGSKVIIKQTAEGSGVTISIKEEHKSTYTNICDMGYGVAQLLSIMLSIETAIFNKQSTHTKDDITLSIEEPESHLHPKYQSMLAAMFADAYINHGIHFTIETHSEYMIRSFQKLIGYGRQNNEYGLSKDDLSIYYFNAPRKDQRPPNEPQIKKIEIADDGCLLNPFGSGFFDEALNLSTDLLRIKLERYAKQ